jgi:hypothetical protein
MKPDYIRLLEAAETLKGWKGPAQVSVNLTLNGYKVTEQTLSNWKNRGLSEAAYPKASRIIGCEQEWLETGKKPMVIKDRSSTRQSKTTSPRVQRIIARLEAADSSGGSPPKVLTIIEAALDMGKAEASPDAYPGLNSLPEE